MSIRVRVWQGGAARVVLHGAVRPGPRVGRGRGPHQDPAEAQRGPDRIHHQGGQTV